MKYDANRYPKCTVPASEVARVKGLGFLRDKRTEDCFNARVITRNGKISADEMYAIADAARRFGAGEVAFTTRQTVEVQSIPFEMIQPFCAFLADHGLMVGGTGPRVRPIVSCKGTSCVFGLIDTYSLSEKIHHQFYVGYHTVKLPHKFKIAVGGCPNNCVKPDLNDLGIIGARVPHYDIEKCRGCKKCQIEQACPIKVATMKDGKLVIDTEACNNCGRCVGTCPFHCNDESTYGYKVYVGGRWGKRVAHGQMLNKIFTDKAEVMQVVEKAILLFRSEGISGERFADTINRIGFERAQELLLGDELLQRKNEILGLNVVGGATC